MEAYMSERTDKWHDTESGMNFTEWKGDWADFELEHLILIVLMVWKYHMKNKLKHLNLTVNLNNFT
jgi:hypothetical protein